MARAPPLACSVSRSCSYGFRHHRPRCGQRVEERRLRHAHLERKLDKGEGVQPRHALRARCRASRPRGGRGPGRMGTPLGQDGAGLPVVNCPLVSSSPQARPVLHDLLDAGPLGRDAVLHRHQVRHLQGRLRPGEPHALGPVAVPLPRRGHRGCARRPCARPREGRHTASRRNERRAVTVAFACGACCELPREPARLHVRGLRDGHGGEPQLRALGLPRHALPLHGPGVPAELAVLLDHRDVGRVAVASRAREADEESRRHET